MYKVKILINAAKTFWEKLCQFTSPPSPTLNEKTSPSRCNLLPVWSNFDKLPCKENSCFNMMAYPKNSRLGLWLGRKFNSTCREDIFTLFSLTREMGLMSIRYDEKFTRVCNFELCGICGNHFFNKPSSPIFTPFPTRCL